jgi:hypothetical protein
MFLVACWSAALTQPPAHPYPLLSRPELHSIVPPAKTRAPLAAV